MGRTGAIEPRYTILIIITASVGALWSLLCCDLCDIAAATYARCFFIAAECRPHGIKERL